MCGNISHFTGIYMKIDLSKVDKKRLVAFLKWDMENEGRENFFVFSSFIFVGKSMGSFGTIVNNND